MRLGKNHDIGSGYPSDPKTKLFVKKSIKRNQDISFFTKELEACTNFNEKKKIILTTLLLPLHDPYRMDASQLFALFETVFPVFLFLP